ncbi:MAG: hypothetical protein IKB30_01350 [Clostridia bacterium]|nr:hypothetical protein [Clostridia bacterium]
MSVITLFLALSQRMADFLKGLDASKTGFLRDFCKGITLLVIGIAKSRKKTSIAI